MSNKTNNTITEKPQIMVHLGVALGALVIAQSTFKRYADHHEAKGDRIKARDNSYLAELMQFGIDSLEFKE